MKTINFRLFATIITLAAVTTTFTVSAQRRSTGSSGSTENTEKSTEERRNTIAKKSSSIDNAHERKATERTGRYQVESNRSSASMQHSRNENERPARESRSSAKETGTRSNESVRTNAERQANSDSNHGRTVGSAVRTSRENYNSSKNTRSGMSASVSNRERYNLNDDDERYRTTSNYRGSNSNWTPELRAGNKHNNGNMKSGHHNHWDNSWEHYRWNHNSWKNYYNYYDRDSYCHHKYYYHHQYYGHVIRRFVVKPAIFVHNHNRYYCYDGHFFRYHPGIGYILVDIPYAMTFEYLPDDFERVYINGYLYFRVDNMFFEYTNAGYQLIHYPERYYAYDDNFYNEGFRFEFRIN